MKTLRAAALAVAVLAASTALAQSKTKLAPGWAKEPESVLGLRLGEPLPEGEPRACGGVQIQDPPPTFGFCSMNEAARQSIPLAGFKVDVFETGLLSAKDGVADALHITAKHENYKAVKAVLIERYGQPQSRSVEKVRSYGGAAYDSETLIWSGRKLLLVAKERSGQVDQTSIMFVTKEGLARSTQEDKATVRRNANQL